MSYQPSGQSAHGGHFGSELFYRFRYWIKDT